MPVSIDPSVDGLKLLTQRSRFVRKMAADRGMDPAQFRELFYKRAKLLTAAQREGSADSEIVQAQIREATEALFGQAEPPSAQFVEWLSEADWIVFRLEDAKIRSQHDERPTDGATRAMSLSIKAALVIAVAIIIGAWLHSYLSPFQSCVREAESQPSLSKSPAVLCARLLGGKR